MPRTYCPRCDEPIDVSGKLGDRRIRCPECDERFTPAPVDPPPTARPRRPNRPTRAARRSAEKRGKTAVILLMGIPAVLLIVGGIAAGTWFYMKKPKDAPVDSTDGSAVDPVREREVRADWDGPRTIAPLGRRDSGGIMPLHTCRFSPDGGMLAVGGISGAWLHEMPIGFDYVVSANPFPVQRIAFSREGNQLALATPFEIRVIDPHARQNQQPRFVARGGGPSVGMAFRAGGTKLITADVNGLVEFDLTAGGAGRPLPNRPGGLFRDIFLLPDDRTLVTVGGTVDWTDLETGRPLPFDAAPVRNPVSATMSPDGGSLALGMGGGTVVVINTTDRRIRATISTGRAMVTSVALSQTGKYLLTSDLHQGGGPAMQGSIAVWEVSTGRHLANLNGHASGSTGIALSPNARTAAVTGWNGSTTLWGLSELFGK